MKKIQIMEVILITALGLALSIEGFRLGMRKDLQLYDVLGPGRYLIVIGICLILVGVAYLITQRKYAYAIEEQTITKEMRIRMLSVIGALVLYNILMSYFGYLPATIVFFILVFRIMEIKSWLQVILLSVFSSASLWIIFVYWLNMVFPRGIFG